MFILNTTIQTDPHTLLVYVIKLLSPLLSHSLFRSELLLGRLHLNQVEWLNLLRPYLRVTCCLEKMWNRMLVYLMRWGFWIRWSIPVRDYGSHIVLGQTWDRMPRKKNVPHGMSKGIIYKLHLSSYIYFYEFIIFYFFVFLLVISPILYCMLTHFNKSIHLMKIPKWKMM